MKKVKLILYILTLTPFLILSSETNSTVNNLSESEFTRNIILMIGDGMGPEQVKLGKWVEVGKSGSLNIDSLNLIANVTTHSSDDPITDSAAGATAIGTGNKTNNGYLAMDPNSVILETILEYSQKNLKSTGLVTTTGITHATPAAFATHVVSRYDTNSIVEGLLNSDVDVLLGGGSSDFSALELAKLRSKSYTIIDNKSMLESTSESKIFGTFAEFDIPYVQDRNELIIPSLYLMTQKTLEILSTNEKGFFLMVEGGRIDHAGHANNKVNAALEMIEFDNVIKIAKDYVDAHPNTLLIVTADHETGGLSINLDSLNDTLPVDKPENEKQALRISRANNIDVSWSSTSHTSTFVPVYIYGENTSALPINEVYDNTDIYPIMKAFFPEPPPEFFLTSTSQSSTLSSSQSSESQTNSETGSASGFTYIQFFLLIFIVNFFLINRKRRK